MASHLCHSCFGCRCRRRRLGLPQSVLVAKSHAHLRKQGRGSEPILKEELRGEEGKQGGYEGKSPRESIRLPSCACLRAITSIFRASTRFSFHLNFVNTTANNNDTNNKKGSWVAVGACEYRTHGRRAYLLEHDVAGSEADGLLVSEQDRLALRLNKSTSRRTKRNRTGVGRVVSWCNTRIGYRQPAGIGRGSHQVSNKKWKP